MSRDLLPEPWRTALKPKGIDSKRGLARKTGISPQTASRLVDGEGQPSPATVAAVADEFFDGDRTRVWELAGLSRQDYGDWDLPPEASQLDPDQRAAVLAVVRAMLPREEKRGGRDVARDTAPIAKKVSKASPLQLEFDKALRELRAARGDKERQRAQEYVDALRAKLDERDARDADTKKSG